MEEEGKEKGKRLETTISLGWPRRRSRNCHPQEVGIGRGRSPLILSILEQEGGGGKKRRGARATRKRSNSSVILGSLARSFASLGKD
jgi:hypothetical protein